METTPSLACANKCVFCWRHHSNPVGTEWKWKMDPAETVLEGALENHYKMIKQMKGETLDIQCLVVEMFWAHFCQFFSQPQNMILRQLL